MSIELVLGPMTNMQTMCMVAAFALEGKVFGKPAAILDFHEEEYVVPGILTCEGGSFPCIRTNQLLNVAQQFESVYIHNAHRFPDLKSYVLEQNSTGVNCFIYAVDSDHTQSKVGEVWDLLPFAHSVSKQLPICSNPRCLKLATCSRKYNDRFLAVCPNCR